MSSTVEGRKSLVKVDMVVQNCLTRITYRVSSTAPIAIILPKVSFTQHAELDSKSIDRGQ